MRKRLLIILDGLGDRPIKEFDGKTPLEQAKTPYMDYMAKEGVCGVLNAMPKDLYRRVKSRIWLYSAMIL